MLETVQQVIRTLKSRIISLKISISDYADSEPEMHN